MEELKIILNEIVRDYGLKTLEDSQKFKAVFADYAKGEFTGEKELYMKIIEAGAAKEIMNSGNISATKDALVKKIHDKYFIDEKICANCIDLFISIIRNDYSLNNVKEEKSQKSGMNLIKEEENNQIINSNNDYVVKGKYTLEDFVQFNKVLVKKNVKKTIIPMIISFGASIFVIAIGGIEFGIFLLIFDVIFFPLIFLLPTTKAHCKKFYDKDNLNKEEQIFNINRNSIQITSSNMSININKSQINKFLFDDNSIYIMTGANQGFIIKDRYCKNQHEFINLKGYFANY